ncbi:MAG: hypothetical protein ACK448_03485 [Bacteroidota bacterium]|jgi:hypothetical protein
MGIKNIFNCLSIVLLLQLTLLSSCENINPPDNTKNNNAEYLELEQCNDFYSLIELALDVCEQIEGPGVPANWNGLSLGKVLSIESTDSVFYDGDEIRFELNFGSLSDSKITGVSADGRWRYGKVEFRIDKYFKEIGSQAEVKFNSPFCSSLQDDHLFTGELLLTRITSNTVKIEVKSMKLSDNNETKIEFDGQLNYQCVTSANVLKVWGNDFQVTGSIIVTAFDDNISETVAQYTVVNPLLRKLEAGCNNSPISGLLNCKFTDEVLTATVEFDPFENQACDNFVRISTRDRVFDYIIEP